MGSFFSRSEQQHAVGDVRPREASSGNRAYEQSDHRPAKRRRVTRARGKQDSVVIPPTRAMQNRIGGTTVQGMTADTGATVLVQESGAHSGVDKNRRKKRKVAVFLGYIGEKYSGMQINPGVVTIEQVLLRAFHSAGMISDENKDSLSKVHWMRAARTDKGVSAAGQCVSARLECELDNLIDPKLTYLINQHLPEDVQVYGMLRATGGFNARSDCHRRRYEYMFPVRLLGGINGIQEEVEEGQGDPRCAKLTSILRLYEGTHCFANFTDGLTGSDATARRYMIRVRCCQPFLPPKSGVYYATVEVYGQSFLLHQIRKMIGLALFIYLGHAPVETIPVALSPLVKIPTPMAPALGLLLDSLMFDNYNQRYGSKLDKPISSEAFGDVKNTFKSERIYAKIAERERLERILEAWVQTCNHKLLYKEEDVLEKHEKFVLTNKGKEEQRKAYVASLYSIMAKESDFVIPPNPETSALTNDLRLQFEERYGCAPTFLARAPGRVILIGEHLDYNGFPVIATALSQGTLVAGCLDNTEHVEVQHLENTSYCSGQLRADGLRMASDEKEDVNQDYNWIQYVSWGVKALVKHLPTKRTVSGGGRLLFCGNLPRAGGLASSSSLVTISALAAARLNRKRFPKLDLALTAAEGERIGAGTRGGAVDHCVSMCGVKNSALKISFTPHVSVNELSLPLGMSLYAVDSCIKAEKGFDELIKRQYNLRAAECRIAAALLARRLDVNLEKSVTTPGQLLFQARKTSRLQCKDIGTLMERASGVMSANEVLSVQEVRRELDVSDKEWRNRFLVGVEATQFSVGKRIAHVFTETVRVERWAEVSQDSALDDVKKVHELGKILNEGHKSLQNLLESSCDEIDELVAFLRSCGAAGSRMTGAGWGGYTINVVPHEKVVTFLENVVSRLGKDAVLEVNPSSGACIFAIHNSFRAPQRENSHNPI